MRRAAARYAARGALDVAGELEQVRADRVEPVMPGDALVVLQRRQQLQPGLRAARHRQRDRVVERDHRVRRDPLEHAVQRDDLRPVGVLGARGLVVDGGDRRLQLVGAGHGVRQRVG